MDASTNGIANPTESPSLGEHLGRSLTARFGQFETQVRHLRKKVKARPVHDLRVAVRRLNALLELVRETAPLRGVGPLRKRLKRCLDSLGELRDAEVQEGLVAGLLEHFPALDDFHADLQRRVRKLRKAARDDMREVSLKKLRRRQKALLVEAAPHWSEVLDDRHRAQAAEGVDQAFSAVIEARTRLNVTDLQTVHEMRIAFKKFRYMVEVLSPFLTGVGTAQFNSMHAFQSMMGDIHDMDVLSQALAAYKEHARRPSRLASAIDELSHRLLMAADSFVTASDEIFSFWDRSWFQERRRGE